MYEGSVKYEEKKMDLDMYWNLWNAADGLFYRFKCSQTLCVFKVCNGLFFKYILICLPFIYIMCVGVSNLKRYKARYPDRSIAGGRALLIMYALALIPVFTFLAYKCDILQRPRINPMLLVPKEVKQEESRKEQKTKTYEEIQALPYGKVEDAYHKLYEEVLSMSYPTTEDCYNAKGNFYALLKDGVTEYNGERVPYKITMVYDRISDDGNYHMFVNYREYITKEGTDTEFGLEYYVNMDTGEIKAEGVPWGD